MKATSKGAPSAPPGLRSYSSARRPGRSLAATGIAVVSALVIGSYLSRNSHASALVPGKSSQTPKTAVEMLTPAEATRRLQRHEQSFLVPRGKGIVRYDTVQVASNDPIEDDHVEQWLEHHGADWAFFGVMDGHSGWTTSKKLSLALVPYVARELQAARSPREYDRAITQGFRKLDSEICTASIQHFLANPTQSAAAQYLMPALSGSCALLGFYDSGSRTLRLACTGDSRAVLGRREGTQGWRAHPLTVDQTGSNPDEIQRLQREHPGEDKTVVRNGRVLGNLEPSRAFGDARYKWTAKEQNTILATFGGAGRRVHPFLYTPPYVTAEPVVSTAAIRPGAGDFVVLATDGLWERLSNEEVVSLVGNWLDARAAGRGNGASWFASLTSWLQPPTSAASPGLHSGSSGGGQKAPPRRRPEGRFVYEDANAATHLVRNALGGKDRDQVCALLSIPAPQSRAYRDDLTVTVVFFGEQEPQGEEILVNADADATIKSRI